MEVDLKLSAVFFALVLILSSTGPLVECANILFYNGFGGTSHRLPVEPLARALRDKGHNVTFLGQDKPQDAATSKINYYVHDKLSHHFTTIMKEGDNGFDFYEMRKSGNSYIGSTIMLTMFGIKTCELLYEDPEYSAFLKNNKFDLVIVDTLINECGYAIAHLHNAKLMLVSVSSVQPWVIEALGIPDESSSVPEMMFNFQEDMSFIQRLGTTITPVFWKLHRHYYYFRRLDEITRNSLGQDFPSVAELEEKVNLVFMNTHVAQEYPRSLPPNVIPVGGMSWVLKAKPLPKKLEDFINKGKEGFVYVSFGSNVEFSKLPAEKQEAFLTAVRKFPQIQFVWKMKTPPPNLPDNIYTDKWLPQADILLHPKAKAFVTHAGLGGLNEGIFGSVPMICFPVFAEQDYNAQLVKEKGIGIKLEITTVTAEEFEDALREVLYNSKYRDNIKRITKHFLDRPHSPVESAVWWTEYVLRHDDTRFLWPRSLQQSWWVKRQLDVWATIFALLTLVVLIPTWVVWKVVKKCFTKSTSSSSKNAGKKVKRN